MSHYTCLVVGEDVDGQLAPFDENMSVEPYKAYWDTGELERWESVLKQRTYERRNPETKEVETHEWDDDQVLDEAWSLEDMQRVYMARFVILGLDAINGLHVDDGGLYEWSTYNPKSKWDWWEIGGRWCGFFKLKEHALVGAHVGRPGVFDNDPTHDADQARKGDIDIEWMRDEAGQRARELWDRVNEIVGHLPKALSWEEHFVGRLKLADAGEDAYTIEQARTDYHEQPAVKALSEWHDQLPDEEKFLGWFDPKGVENFQVPREEYVQEARDEALCPYSWLMDGQWHAPGKMGWFGNSTDTRKDRAHFRREFNEMLDALPDDTLLTLCDLHI